MWQLKIFKITENNYEEVQKEINEFAATHALAGKPYTAVKYLENGIVAVGYYDYEMVSGLSTQDQLSIVDQHISKGITDRIYEEISYRILMSKWLAQPGEDQHSKNVETAKNNVAKILQDLRHLSDIRKEMLEGNWDAFATPEYLQGKTHGLKLLKPGEEPPEQQAKN